MPSFTDLLSADRPRPWASWAWELDLCAGPLGRHGRVSSGHLGPGNEYSGRPILSDGAVRV